MNIKYITSTLLIVLVLIPMPTRAQNATPHPDGSLINMSGTIFLIKKQIRYGFRNPQEFFSHGYNFDMVLPVNEGDLKLPQGEPLRARDGTLANDIGDKQNTYFIFAGKARLIEEETLYLLAIENYPRFSLDLTDYEKGNPLTLLETFKAGHPGTLVMDNKTIYIVAQSGLAPFSTPEIYHSYGYIFGMARNINSEEIKLPKISQVPYRDGTLVNDRGTIFLISEGKKYGFKTMQGFLNRGYKLKVSIKGSTDGYDNAENYD